ncbi:nitrate assimilation regulatory protein nira-like protein [Colletotrichum truncatum]|uniref:Nitrate assimilation regulatory protein nira-like protein n=1 Tax=Colletotrichum truncatum TaxID=5467 RepID=A0ACC3ZH43_COLTU|nr:nitrate assimilation regulatory protein nira-like protein [Colletotrichum truncatum]KAF6784646.1 nitrate assimilation regulatory protein nira-like protein [Colletotrichum truncatum]
MADLFGSSSGGSNNNNNNSSIPKNQNNNHNSNDSLGRHLRPDRPPTAATPTNQADLSAPAAAVSSAAATAAVTTSASSVSPKPTKRSSATTCVTCRARKVRCDGRRDICSNCERLGFSCTYEDPNSDPNGLSSAPSFPLPRRRVRQACESCHSRKARCSGDTPACVRCRAQGLECVYRASKRARLSIHHAPRVDATLRSPTTSSSATAAREQHTRRSHSREDAAHDSDAGAAEAVASNTPSTFNQELSVSDPQFESLISRALDNFFRHVHHIPMLSFLHRASLMQRHHAGRLDRPLLLALIGITSMLTDLGPGTREYGEKCVDESETLILKSLENPSTIKVQTLALIIKYRILNRRFSSAFVLAATAARFAMALRLNHENNDLCFLAQESRRRLMWALFMIDQGMAGGYRDLTLWTPELIHISLPCNERDFEFDLAPPSMRSLVPSPDESENDDIGSLALHVRILWVRGRILKFAKRAAACSNDEDLGRLRDQLQSFAKELAEFAERLPVSFRWSDNSLRLRAYSPRLCVFIMIHIWWRQCHCDLYRLGLVGLRDSLSRSAAERLGPDFISGCQRQCFEHALEMSNMFTSIKQLDHYPVADLDMPVCAYQCVRMLYYIYHLNADEYSLTPDILRKKASICLEVTKGCCSGTAAVSIQSDLQRLMDHGLSVQVTPSRLASEEPHGATNGTGPKRVSRLGRAKQVQLVDDPDSGAPAADELTNRPFGIGAWEDIQVPESEKPDEPAPMPPQHAVQGSLEVNNAFEGALDSLDFNMEPMGLDSLAWFSNEWAQGDFQTEF